MMNSNESRKIETLNQIPRQGIFAFVAVTQKTALKKSRVTKLPTPMQYTTITKVIACTVSLGNDYESVVNARLLKEGQDVNFESQSTYCVPIAPNRLIFKHKERDQYYLRVYPNLCKSFKTITRYTDAHGVALTKEEYRAIEAEYLPLNAETPNANQGLDNPVLVNNYKLENVKYLKHGDILVDELTTEILDILSDKR